MPKHMTGTREEWLAARLDLLEAEKELTRRSDAVARRRQALAGAAASDNGVTCLRAGALSGI